jgi:hypothetical protein
MTTQSDDVVKDAKRSAKEEIAELLKRQNGSSTVIDTRGSGAIAPRGGSRAAGSRPGGPTASIF